MIHFIKENTLLACLLLLFTGPLSATTYTSNAVGNWSDAGSWDGNGVPPNPLPFGDAINVGHNLTLTGSLTINGALNWSTAGASIALNQPISGTGIVSVSGSIINITANISMTGEGSLSLTSTVNISVSLATTNVSVENGNMTFSANSGSSAGNFIGIHVNAAKLTTSGNGNISLTGKGGNTGNNQHGIAVQAAGVVESTSGTGTITLNGTSGASNGGICYGVYVNGANSLVQSSSGNIQATGVSLGTATGNNQGVMLESGGQIKSDGSAAITVTGTGGSAQLGVGIHLLGSNSAIISSGGDISLTGTGGNAANGMRGFFLETGSQITATNNANITIGGTGGSTSGNNRIGVAITGSTSISSENGSITITGTGGGGTGTGHVGISFAGTIASTGGGAISLTGTRGIASADGIQFSTTGVIDAGSSTVTLTSNAGNITSGTATTDVVANTLSITTTNGTIGASGNPLVFNAANISTNSSSGNSAQFLSETNNVTITSMTAGTGAINLVSGNFLGGASITTSSLTSTSASFSPGSSPGTLTISGALNMGTGTYYCDINGTTPGTGHDVLAIGGNATLSNASLVVDWGSYTPTAGQTFDVMTFASRTGTFANVTIPSVSGLNFTVSYTSTKITLNAAAVLPVELVDFKAKKVDTGVQLEWTTASELNADRFEVERSTDGFSFEKIGERPAAGIPIAIGTVEQRYVFLHENPSAGMNYYRLRQMDVDGKEEYSKVVSVSVGTDWRFELKVFPNPVSHHLNLDLPTNMEDGEMARLFDITGRLVMTAPIAKGINLLDVSSLPAGTYLLEIIKGTTRFVEKVMVE